MTQKTDPRALRAALAARPIEVEEDEAVALIAAEYAPTLKALEHARDALKLAAAEGTSIIALGEISLALAAIDALDAS